MVQTVGLEQVPQLAGQVIASHTFDALIWKPEEHVVHTVELEQVPQLAGHGIATQTLAASS